MVPDIVQDLRNHQVVEAFALDGPTEGQSLEDNVGHMRIHVHLRSEDDARIYDLINSGNRCVVDSILDVHACEAPGK